MAAQHSRQHGHSSSTDPDDKVRGMYIGCQKKERRMKERRSSISSARLSGLLSCGWVGSGCQAVAESLVINIYDTNQAKRHDQCSSRSSPITEVAAVALLGREMNEQEAAGEVQEEGEEEKWEEEEIKTITR